MPTISSAVLSNIICAQIVTHSEDQTNTEGTGVRVENSQFRIADSRLHVAWQFHPHENEAADKAHCHRPEPNELKSRNSLEPHFCIV